MRALIFILAALLSELPAQAQTKLLQAHASAATFTGPGDIVSGAIMWYGLRGYSAAVAATGTQKAVNIRRASDSATSDIVILTTGDLAVATATTFCNATTCFVTKIYDQSGANKCSAAACDVSQATAAQQPQLLLSGGAAAGKPYIKFVRASSQVLISGAPSVTAQPYSISVVATRTGSVTSFQNLVGSANIVIAFTTSANTMSGYAGAVAPSIAAADSAWHAGNVNITNAAGVIYVDGANASGNPSTGVLGTTAINISQTNFLEGGIEEGGIWNVGFAAGDAGSMNSNQHTYWGF